MYLPDYKAIKFEHQERIAKAERMRLVRSQPSDPFAYRLLGIGRPVLAAVRAMSAVPKVVRTLMHAARRLLWRTKPAV